MVRLDSVSPHKKERVVATRLPVPRPPPNDVMPYHGVCVCVCEALMPSWCVSTVVIERPIRSIVSCYTITLSGSVKPFCVLHPKHPIHVYSSLASGEIKETRCRSTTNFDVTVTVCEICSRHPVPSDYCLVLFFVVFSRDKPI